MRLLREYEVFSRLGLGKSKFRSDFVARDDAEFVPGTGILRLKAIPLGGRSHAFLENEVDELIAALATHRVTPQPQPWRRAAAAHPPR